MLVQRYRGLENILEFRSQQVAILYGLLNSVLADGETDMLHEVFGELSDNVRFINVIKSVTGKVVEMFVSGGTCNIFVKNESGILRWYTFSSGSGVGDFEKYQPIPSRKMDFPLSDEGWIVKAANRDLPSSNQGEIQDAFLVHFRKGEMDLWWLSSEDCYLAAGSGNRIQDIAYEQYGRSTYVLFEGDTHLYKYDNVS